MLYKPKLTPLSQILIRANCSLHLRMVKQQSLIFDIKNKLERTHYLCERCGGSGFQQEGCWDRETRTYSQPSGTCRCCDGTGFLGPKEERDASE